MISAHWSFIRDTVVPKPGAGEVVMTKAWVERGLSLPCSEFFLSILTTYGLQPHNICPNSYLLLSNFVTLCEGHLGIRPDVKLWQFFFRVKKETKDKAMLNCGSMTFMLRPGRMYPPHDSHESVRYWNAGWFYEKNVSVPEIHDGLPKFNNEPPEELASWSFIPSLSLTPILEKAARRISWRFKTLKVGRGQPIPELIKDIYTNNQCPPLATLAEENLRTILRVPSAATRRRRFRRMKRRKRSKHFARTPTTTATGTASQELITKFMKKSPAVGPATPAPPSASHTAPPPSPPQADQSPPAANTPPEIIPVSSEKVGGEDPKAKGPAQEETQDQGEAEVTSSEKEQQALHYELHKNIALQRRVTLGQAENIRTLKDKNAELNKQLADAQGASSSLATTSSELENLRSSYQELETKLKEAEQQKERAEKQLAEKNSELIREKGEFVLKQPLGYPEKRRNKFPRDDVLSLAGDDCKDLISASRKICHNLSLKRSRTCGLRKLIKRMDILPELVQIYKRLQPEAQLL
ncbi:hypothetical protein QYE76_017712 [Lolium multiflorum]|uniref:Transposase (putative) gypsy type domain-containing protein n=1 Tax=Lolium multiflorum TaxID=4521 RepID=A0AAD8PH12_LOLMU|nr:hypothetical protein QYE76_017712 [Lolium multiflorum]